MFACRAPALPDPAGIPARERGVATFARHTCGAAAAQPAAQGAHGRIYAQRHTHTPRRVARQRARSLADARPKSRSLQQPRSAALVARPRSMTRPKAPKPKQRAGSEGPSAGPPHQQQQQQQHAAAHQQQQQQAAAKKRPAEGGAPGAAAAPAAGEPPEVDQLERKRMQVAEELRLVEKQASRGACGSGCRCKVQQREGLGACRPAPPVANCCRRLRLPVSTTLCLAFLLHCARPLLHRSTTWRATTSRRVLGWAQLGAGAWGGGSSAAVKPI